MPAVRSMFGAAATWGADRKLEAPGLRRAKLIEWRAQRIRDPISRLRYLQGALERPQGRTAALWSRARRRPGALMLLVFILFQGRTAFESSAASRRTPAPPSVAVPNRSGPGSDIWLVEKKAGGEFYSNGLRIEGAFAVANRSRSYQVANRVLGERISQTLRTEPAGIVFHTTESHLAPFEAGRNRQLKRIGEELLRLVRANRSYHFVIDRFGRVFRIVHETDVAHHAGWSIWADEQWTYVNLNESFLGVAFESQSRAGDELPEISPAQVSAARALVQMLRARYRIPEGNCVTHAQVSVNPDNRRIGYHTDWAGNFPYAELGLPDNYARPLASVFVFGFNYDPTFLASTGVRLWKGLLEAEEQVSRQAALQGLTVIEYKASLQKKYRETLASLRTEGEAEEEAR